MNKKVFTTRQLVILPQILFLFLVSSGIAFAAEADAHQGQSIVRYMLIPLQFMVTYVAYIMAFFFLTWGLYKLRHSQEGGGYNRQSSGAGSVLCFLAAALLFQYQHAVRIVGNSFLGLDNNITTGWIIGSDSDGNRVYLPQDPVNLFGYYTFDQCMNDAGKKDPDSTEEARRAACQAFASGGDSDSSGILSSGSAEQYNWKDEGSFATIQTLFATLMLIGFISFIRGAMLIVKCGEGMGSGESTGSKAVVHILAGGLLCNANHVAAVIHTVTDQVH